MTFSRRTTAICGVALLAIAAAAFIVFRSRHNVSSASQMVACLPQAGATIAYIDVAALRSGGLLDFIAGSKPVQDPEYKTFVEGTGFDYRKDLDALAASFTGSTAFFVARGRFDWPRLTRYAESHTGECHNEFCRVPGTAPGRWVSFWRMQGDVLALASGADANAARDIAPKSVTARQPGEAATRPIWISVPPAVLTEEANLPAGARSFTSPLGSAEQVVFSAGASGKEVRLFLDVLSPSEQGANDLQGKLVGATDMLRKMLEREHQQASEGDLSGLLVGGTFRRDGRKVHGEWPVHRKLIESVAGGASS